jgi:hypothetical protein
MYIVPMVDQVARDWFIEAVEGKRLVNPSFQ